MLTKNNYCQSDEHLRNLLTKTQNANSSSCCHRHCTGSPWCMPQSCFPFCSCQVSPPNHLTLGWWMSGFRFLESVCLEIALQCLLSELLWVVEVSQGFFLLFSSFLFRDGSRAWCMLNKCADLSYLSIPPSPPPWVKRLQIPLTGLELALYPDIPWVCRPLASASQGSGITWLCHQGHLFLSAVCHGRFTKFFIHFFLILRNSQFSKWENVFIHLYIVFYTLYMVFMYPLILPLI